MSTIKQPKFQTNIICAPVLDFIDCFFRSCGHLGGEWRVLWKSTVGGDQSKKGLKKEAPLDPTLWNMVNSCFKSDHWLSCFVLGPCCYNPCQGYAGGIVIFLMIMIMMITMTERNLRHSLME